MRRVIVLVLVLIPAFASGNNTSVPEGLSRGLTEIGAAEGILSTMERSIGNLNAITTRFRLEDKLVQADLFFEEGKYEKSALLYRDCVLDPAMKGRQDYYTVLFKLGNSLFKQGNYLSALHFYRFLIKPEAGKFYFMGLAGALNSAIRLKQPGKVADLAEMGERLVSASSNDELSYVLGKYYYHVQNYQACDSVLGRILPTSKYYRRAMYYRAAFAVRTKHFPKALNFFNAITSGKAPGTLEDQEVISQAYQGKARVLSYTGKPDQALKAYDKVPASSREYLQSLYEMAWVYLAKKQPKAAVNILDILLLNLPEGNLALSAMALKGRVLARMNDHIGASEAYKNVTRILAPVTRELDMLSDSPLKLKTYFNFVITNGSKHFNLDVPISDVTMKWLNFDPDLLVIQRVFFSLSRQQKEAMLVDKGLDDMKYILHRPSKVDIFPRLRDNYYKVMEIKNRTLMGFSDAVGAVAARIMSFLSPRDRKRLVQLEEQRMTAYRSMSKMPLTARQYKAEHKDIHKRFMLVEQQIFKLETAMQILKKELIGIEGIARRKEEQDKEGETGRITDSIDIEVEKNRLKALYQQIEDVRTMVEREVSIAGKSSREMQHEIGRRNDLLSIITMENSFIVSRLGSLPPGMSAMLSPIRVMNKRAMALFSRSDQLASQLKKIGESTTKRFMALLTEQSNEIKNALKDINRVGVDARSFANKEGKSLFLVVKKRFTQLLFEAELGRVEMAWRRKSDLVKKLDKLGKERTEKMKTVAKARALLSELKSEMKTLNPSNTSADKNKKRKGNRGDK